MGNNPNKCTMKAASVRYKNYLLNIDLYYYWLLSDRACIWRFTLKILIGKDAWGFEHFKVVDNYQFTFRPRFKEMMGVFTWLQSKDLEVMFWKTVIKVYSLYGEVRKEYAENQRRAKAKTLALSR